MRGAGCCAAALDWLHLELALVHEHRIRVDLLCSAGSPRQLTRPVSAAVIREQNIEIPVFVLYRCFNFAMD